MLRATGMLVCCPRPCWLFDPLESGRAHQGRHEQTSIEPTAGTSALSGLACKSRPSALSMLVNEQARHASRLEAGVLSKPSRLGQPRALIERTVSRSRQVDYVRPVPLGRRTREVGRVRVAVRPRPSVHLNECENDTT